MARSSHLERFRLPKSQNMAVCSSSAEATYCSNVWAAENRKFMPIPANTMIEEVKFFNFAMA